MELGKTCVMTWDFELYHVQHIYITMTGVPCVTCSKKEDEKDKEKESTEPKVGMLSISIYAIIMLLSYKL